MAATGEVHRDVELLTLRLASASFESKGFHSRRDDDTDHENEDADLSTISKSFILEELLETGEAETLEIYKDIVSEKMNSQSKIPTPSTKRYSMISTPSLYKSESKLPLSASNRVISKPMSKKESTGSLRSVSDSPLSSKIKIDETPLRTPSRRINFQERRLKGRSMIIQPSQRLVHDLPLSSKNRNTVEMSPDHGSRLPSYLKQTSASMRKSITTSKDNKENHVFPMPLVVEKNQEFVVPTVRKFRTPGKLNPVPEKSHNDTSMHTLNIPKIRHKVSNIEQDHKRISLVPKQDSDSSKMTRSHTQGFLNLLLNNNSTPVRLRKISSSQEVRKVSKKSETKSHKIASSSDLYQTIGQSPLVKTWEKINKHTFAKVTAKTVNEVQGHSRYKLLNNFERAEVMRRQYIYYIGDKRKPEVEISNLDRNFGFDDKNANYLTETGDHLQYRFRVLSKLGSGAFGSVLACNDYKSDKKCAVKIVKNEMTCSLQAVTEVKTLKLLSQHQHENRNIIEFYNHFHFRGHMCITTEYLPINLYQVLEVSNFKGFSLPVISNFADQILSALEFLHSKLGIIHCDLKPENLMLVSPDRFDIKLIDFGSSVAVNEISYSYLQSRFYRAPEVTLGARYDTKIDIWSMATILTELYTGTPLFPCENENDLMVRYLELMGIPEPSVIQKLRKDIIVKGAVGDSINESSMLWQVFNGKGQFLEQQLLRKTHHLHINVKSQTIGGILFPSSDSNSDHSISFVDFIEKCLVWDHVVRPSASRLKRHHFVTFK